MAAITSSESQRSFHLSKRRDIFCNATAMHTSLCKHNVYLHSGIFEVGIWIFVLLAPTSFTLYILAKKFKCVVVSIWHHPNFGYTYYINGWLQRAKQKILAQRQRSLHLELSFDLAIKRAEFQMKWRDNQPIRYSFEQFCTFLNTRFSQVWSSIFRYILLRLSHLSVTSKHQIYCCNAV